MIQGIIFLVVGIALGWLGSRYKALKGSSEMKEEMSELLKENGRLEALSQLRESEAQELESKFQLAFENVSARLFKENTREFSEVSQGKIEEILSPLKQKMETFQANLQEVSKAGTAERLTLKCKIDMMADCSKTLAEETNRLSKTLKGDVKKQGAWGELILQKVLEASGLRENMEYTLQGTGLSLSSEEGRRLQPDVVIHLPEEKKVIVDAKMSYVHYDEYLTRTGDKEKAESLKKLTLSLKEHIRGLSEKNYSSAKNIHAPDFVLLFVPIEAIFSLVIQHEPGLFEEAWKKSIIIVSPTNILAILRTIESIWKTEKQNRNTQKIAEDAASLYDKFVDFIKDLEMTQKHMHTASDQMEKAFSKLSTGRGNLIKKAEDLKKLGLKTKKQLPDSYVEQEALVSPKELN